MGEFQIDPKAIAPERVAISKSKGVVIEWADGHRSEYALKFLRDACPCATCTGAHGQPPARDRVANPLALYKPALKIESVEPVGNYALRIVWNDGHSTGIYSYEHLRLICSCDECRKRNSQV
jgi:DUF971 family protein